MAKQSFQILQLAKRGAEVRFRELVDEMRVLTLSFPHLRDAVDRDDLPVEFILRRGEEKAGRVQAARSQPDDVREGAKGDLRCAEGAVGEGEGWEEVMCGQWLLEPPVREDSTDNPFRTQFRRFYRSHVLCRDNGPARPVAGCLFPAVVDRLLRGLEEASPD